MNANPPPPLALFNVVLLGLKNRVVALSKSDGTILWSTELPNRTDNFVTLVSDDSRVFAYAGGHLHCLELASGQLLWRNELKGYGYGLGTLALPGNRSSPDIAAVRHRLAEEERRDSSSSNSSQHSGFHT